MPLQKITKEEIISICTKVFWANGYYNTSIDDLSKYSGLSKALFYHHFKSKENLMIEAIKQSHTFFRENVFTIFYKNMTKQKKIDELIIVCEKVFCQNMNGCFMGNTILETSRSSPQFKPYINAFFTDWIKGFEHLFEDEPIASKRTDLAEQCIIEIEGALIMMRLKENKKYLINTLRKIKESI
jgi:AcrR family transcriptional regulator